jgi:hypothetical protein
LVREWWGVLRRGGTPTSLIKLLDYLHVDEGSGTMPDFDAIVDAKSRRERSREEESTIWRPLAMRGVRSLDGSNLSEATAIENVDFASKISKTG